MRNQGALRVSFHCRSDSFDLHQAFNQTAHKELQPYTDAYVYADSSYSSTSEGGTAACPLGSTAYAQGCPGIAYCNNAVTLPNSVLTLGLSNLVTGPNSPFARLTVLGIVLVCIFSTLRIKSSLILGIVFTTLIGINYYTNPGACAAPTDFFYFPTRSRLTRPCSRGQLAENLRADARGRRALQAGHGARRGTLAPASYKRPL